MDAPERGKPSLHQIGNPADSHHRPDHHIKIGDKGDKIAHAYPALDNQASTEDQHEEHSDIACQRRYGEHESLYSSHPKIAADIFSSERVELPGPEFLHGIGLDQPDGDEGRAGEFRHQRKLFLDRGKPLMEPGRKNTGAHGQKRHGQKSQQSQQDVDFEHETHGGKGHEGGVHGGDEAHAAGHLHSRQIIADMGHYIPCGVLLKKQCIHLQDVGKDPVPDNPLHDPGEADNHQTPDKTQAVDAQGDQQDDSGEAKQRMRRRGPCGQGVHSSFQDPGNEKLQQINREKREAADKNAKPVLPKDGSDKPQQPVQSNADRNCLLPPCG